MTNLIQKLEFSDVKLISASQYIDERGVFQEISNTRVLSMLLHRSIHFVQTNYSVSRKGALRGLHFQKEPYAQTKMIQVLKGEIFDVILNLDKGSKNFGKHITLVLSDQNPQKLIIPKGYAHGFMALQNGTEIIYHVDNYWNLEHQYTINWKDKDLSIKWPITDNFFISEKDSNGLSFKDFKNL